MAPRFDPLGLVAALERQKVGYVVIGGFARVVHGTGEVTDNLDVVPSTKPENLRRLEFALRELGAFTGGQPLELVEPVAALETERGELRLVPTPAGTRGYDDLRRHATREPLGRGLRPRVASAGDLLRMLGALGRDEDLPRLQTLRRLVELQQQLGLEL